MDKGEKAQLEVKLAIADYFIEQFAGKPEGRKAFEALVGRFVGEDPQHKMVTHMLVPEHESK